MRNSVRFLGRTCIRGGSYENQRVWENQAAVLMRTNPINQWCFLKWQMAVLIRTAARFSGRTSFKKHPSAVENVQNRGLFSLWYVLWKNASSWVHKLFNHFKVWHFKASLSWPLYHGNMCQQLPWSSPGCRTGNGGKLSNSWFDGLTWLCLAAA